MSVLVQISDPHFGTEQPHVVEALVNLVRRIAPSAAVLSGDITQRARRAQFAAARLFVERLGPLEALVIPGNHDIPLFNVIARAFYPYRNFERAFGADLAPCWSSASTLIICVNTTRPSRHKDGEVSEQQIGEVAKTLLQARPEQLRIVVTHQPVHVIRTSDVANLLHGRVAAMRAWSRAGADLIMGGHIHLPYVSELRALYPMLPRRLWAVQAGTAVSSRVRGDIPNSVNIVRRLTNETACIERWDYDGASSQFQKAAEEHLQLDRSTSR